MRFSLISTLRNFKGKLHENDFLFFTETIANWHSIIKNTRGNTAQLSFEWSHFKLQSPCTPQ